MSHDRGCPCGREKYEYRDCDRADCVHRNEASSHKKNVDAEIKKSLENKEDLVRKIMTKREHRVKSWAHFYDAIRDGLKKHDLRLNDRDYQIGDVLILERYDNVKGEYTGESQRAVVTYMTSNRYPCAYSSAVLPRDYVILSLELVK